MMNSFIWCDLSAYRPGEAMAFYESVLGWGFDALQGDYRNAFIGDAAVAGLYEMPAKFRDIGLPSFWMSYIAVDSVEKVIENAKAMGGRIEMEEGKGSDDHVALIRDPLGAGFSVYKGTLEAGATGIDCAGLRSGHALFVSDRRAVIPFYEASFGWQFEQRDGYYQISLPGGEPVATIHECEPEERGGFEYWGIGFTVDDLAKARRRITAAGGIVYGKMPFGDNIALSAADHDEAAFFLIERGG